jgi:hypothetical protein
MGGIAVGENTLALTPSRVAKLSLFLQSWRGKVLPRRAVARRQVRDALGSVLCVKVERGGVTPMDT